MRLNHHYVTNKQQQQRLQNKHTYITWYAHLIAVAITQMARHVVISSCVHAQSGTYMHATRSLSLYIFISDFLQTFLPASSFLPLFSILLLSFDRKSRKRRRTRARNVKMSSLHQMSIFRISRTPNSFKSESNICCTIHVKHVYVRILHGFSA